MSKKILMLLCALLLVGNVAFAGDVIGTCVQRYAGVSDGVAMTIRYVGSFTTGCSVSFSSSGATFYKNGAVDSSIGSSGVVLWASVDDTDQVYTAAGLKDAINRGTGWKADLVDALDTDSPAWSFDTSTLTVHLVAGKVMFQGDVDELLAYAIGSETRTFDQIRVSVRNRKVRLFYCYGSLTSGNILILDAKSGKELWRNGAADATPSIDFSATGQDFVSDFVVRIVEANDGEFASGEYLQIRYSEMDIPAGYGY